ncbi:MAG: DUF5615 family PIN-like protein [Acidimicrobiia bacterium]
MRSKRLISPCSIELMGLRPRRDRRYGPRRSRGCCRANRAVFRLTAWTLGRRSATRTPRIRCDRELSGPYYDRTGQAGRQAHHPRAAGGVYDVLEYPDSSHVTLLDLGDATEDETWRYALDHGFAIVSKDEDFHQRALVSGPPPKVI